MQDILERLAGRKINGVRVVPLMSKIIFIFAVFLLVSNFFSNYINLVLNRGEQTRLLNQILVKDLNDLHVFAARQTELLAFTGDEASAISNIRTSAASRFQLEGSLAMAVRPDGSILFLEGGVAVPERFDTDALQRMNDRRTDGDDEGSFQFELDGISHLGVYRWHSDWDAFFVRAEQESEFLASSRQIFVQVSALIVVISLICLVVGIILIRYILRFVPMITQAIMGMQDTQELTQLDMSDAPNDDVTYLGLAFNSLAGTIDNLMSIFKKFVARDVAAKAYREREIRLEGTQRELTILFTDIRSFTYMTETLGTDIIKLLNLHYDQSIRHIHDHNGDIGSIIGDALLAVFGTMGTKENKSYQAIRAGYLLHDVAASLREKMRAKREEIIRRRGSLTDAEERVYEAVLIEIGVGIDGGVVFYGNIGSYERMVNTVIGDNVNSSSRLEGLTRFYHVPVITSEYVKNEVEKDYADYVFVELDTVQVKGKTEGKQIFWPIERGRIDEQFENDIEAYSEGLQLYYEGKWAESTRAFKRCGLKVAEVFTRRIEGQRAPRNWNGIWTMTEK
ncbi:MAG: adenylate/guanylate cyclase domain-containing protein [Spirochaetaceae bacterium]